jgi:hypothetical protein
MEGENPLGDAEVVLESGKSCTSGCSSGTSLSFALHHARSHVRTQIVGQGGWCRPSFGTC